MHRATVRVYQELTRFLSSSTEGPEIEHEFIGEPSVKDVIETYGIPHAEVDLVLINGSPVSFDARVRDGDRVAAYPVFESLDISRTSLVRAEPLRVTQFVLDCHLGKLARLLRMMGFDTAYERYFTDPEIVEISRKEHRIILTRDVGLLKRRAVTHGYWVRNTDPTEQAVEVLRRFDLARQVHPLARCMECNGRIEAVEKAHIAHRLEPGTRTYYDQFYRCTSCDRLYWRGSHFEKLREQIDGIVEASRWTERGSS
jgi:hypothetical protein